MKKILLVNIAGLVAAAAFFSGSAAYASVRLETASPPPAVTFNDDFLQPDEPGIGALLSDSHLLNPDGKTDSPAELDSSSDISEELSSQDSPPASSTPSSSSELISSQPPPSSEPVSIPPSSEETSSEPVSSEEPSSEPSSEEISTEPSVPDESEEAAPSDDDYSEILERLAGAVQREIVGVGTVPSPQYYEAYKAQAVASHSYMEYHLQHSGAYPQMSYTTPHPKTVELVSEVLDELIYYNGAVINASYHAASGGHTQGASAVWGWEIPYLIGVESAYDDYEAVYSISADSLASKLASAGIEVSGEPDTWFDLAGASLSDGGFVDTIAVCGTPVSCRTLRESVLGSANLKSTKIVDISYDGLSLVFTTRGFGHGVGLSQLGALGYAANEGWDYRMILAHYYTGVTIE